MTKKVIFCIPTIAKPFQQCRDALAASIPLIVGAGWEEGSVYETGNPYISCARATMLRKALDAKADVIVFIDHDLSWRPQDLLTLIETEGDVVSGNYRFKREPEEYMGNVLSIEGTPIVRADGCVSAHAIPAGFLKITKHGVNRFMAAFPELCFGDRFAPHIDLFNHGAHEFVWYGEDYAFARRWTEKCGPIWIVPDLEIVHYANEPDPQATSVARLYTDKPRPEFKQTPYAGNFHEYLLRQPGGSNDPARL